MRIKIFEVRHPSFQYYSWSFRCRVENCDDCKLRFLCFTTGKTVIISDDRLYNLLRRIDETHFRYNHAQRAMRKAFFKWLANRGRKKDIGSVV